MDLTGLTEDEYAAAVEAVQHARTLRFREFIYGDHLPVYVVRQNSDLTEGRGPYVDRGMFFLIEHAEIARGMLEGVQGTANDATVEERRVFVTVDDWLRNVPGGTVLNKPGRTRYSRVAFREEMDR